MALGIMYITVTCPTLGTNTGPFNLYSDADGYASAFATGVTGAELTAGYFTETAPVGTTTVMVQSAGDCKNSILVPITGVPTTTSTTTLPLMWPVVGTCCGLVATEYYPYNSIFVVGSIVAATEFGGFFGGYEITGPPVNAVQTLIPYDNIDYASCGYYSAVFAGVACT